MRHAVILVLALIVTGLLAAGAGIYVWTVMVAVLLGCLVLSLCAWREGSLRRACDPVELALLALLLFLLLTLLPVPLAVTRLTGTQRYAQNEAVMQTARQAALSETIPALPLRFAATRNRAGTIRIVLLLLLAVVAVKLTLRLSPAQQKAYVGLLLVAATGVAVAGHIGQWHLPQGDTLWYLIPVAHGLPGPVGGFINPNHFAGFLALLLPLALARAAAALGSRRWLRGLLLLLLCLPISGAIVTSLSRGGMLAAAAGSLMTLLVLVRRQRRHILPAVVSLFLLAGVALLIVQRMPPVAQRLETLRLPFRTASFTERLDAWRAGVRIWQRYPVIGAGANAFRVTYPQARHTTERDVRTFAENEYVQWLAETGVVGLALLLLLGAAIVSHWKQAGPVSSDACDDALLAGILTVVAVHAVGDFVLRLPLYLFTAASLAALHPRFQTPARRPAPMPDGDLTRRYPAPECWCLVLALLLLPWMRAAQQRDGLGYAGYATPIALIEALSWAPVSPHLWVRLGERFEQSGEAALLPLAGATATRGLELDPHNTSLWLRLGHLRLRTGDTPGAKAAFAEVKRLRSWVPVPDLP